MLALIPSGEGVPQFLPPLDGNASDETELPRVVMEWTRQLRASGEDAAGPYVADSGLYSAANMRALQAAGVRWVRRVPETSRVAPALVREAPPVWQHTSDARLHWWGRLVGPSGGAVWWGRLVGRPDDQQPHQERWLVGRSAEGEQRARATLQRQAEREHAKGEKRWGHRGHRASACEPDAPAALARARAPMPAWLVVQTAVVAVPK